MVPVVNRSTLSKLAYKSSKMQHTAVLRSTVVYWEAGGELIKIIERPLLLELFHRILELSYELRTVDDFIVKYGTPRALTANALASTYNNCNLA